MLIVAPPFWRTSSAPASRVLFRLIGADMNSTADQAFTKIGSFNEWTHSANGSVAVIHRSGASPTSAVGGIYTEAAKGGLQFVGSGQAYSTLSGGVGRNIRLSPNTSGGVPVGAAALFLSLGTPHGAASTCDFYVIGVPLN